MIQTYLLLSLIIFSAGFVQGFSGFGSILLALPILSLFIDIKILIPLMVLCGCSMSIFLLIQLRPHLDLKKIIPLFLGAIPGIPLGVLFLKKINPVIIYWILGLILISYSVYMLFFKSQNRGINEKWGYGFGFLSGFIGGGMSAGGPPVIVYTSLQDWKKDIIKVTLQGFFVVSGLLTILIHALSGLTTSLVIRYYLISIPMLIVGTYLGSFYYKKISEESYRRLLLTLLAALGGFLIYRTF